MEKALLDKLRYQTNLKYKNYTNDQLDNIINEKLEKLGLNINSFNDLSSLQNTLLNLINIRNSLNSGISLSTEDDHNIDNEIITPIIDNVNHINIPSPNPIIINSLPDKLISKNLMLSQFIIDLINSINVTNVSDDNQLLQILLDCNNYLLYNKE